MSSRNKRCARAIVGLSVAMAGCCDEAARCEPAVSPVATPVESAMLPVAWAQGDVTGFRVVATTGPYRVTDAALTALAAVMGEQAGLQVEVAEGTGTGLPQFGILEYHQVIAAANEQMPPGDKPAIVIVVVESTTFPDGLYGFIDFAYSPRLTAVMVLHRGPMMAAAIGPVSLEAIEATVAVHEVGHWLGVPARDSHRSAIDGMHCTCGHCVMFKGSRLTPCVVMANLCTGFPVGFCPECAEELRELQRRRQAAGKR